MYNEVIILTAETAFILFFQCVAKITALYIRGRAYNGGANSQIENNNGLVADHSERTVNYFL